MSKQIFNNHREWIKGWRYKKDAPYDEEWQKDRKELFAESGNGWWWSVPNKIHKVMNRYPNINTVKRRK